MAAERARKTRTDCDKEGNSRATRKKHDGKSATHLARLKKPPFFSREIYFAWLLRSDVREALARNGKEAAEILFLAWWLIEGRKEYPAVPPLNAEQLEIVTRPTAAVPVGVDEPPVTVLMYCLWLLRGDLQDACNILTAEGRTRLVAWYYLFGVSENRLPLTESDRQFLSTAPSLSHTTALPVRLTNLAWLLWNFRDDVHSAFGSLHDSINQLRLIGWYYLHGVKELDLYHYLTQDEHRGLFAPIKPSNQHDQQIAVWTFLSWLSSSELSTRHDLNSASACARLNVWAEGEGRRTYHIEALQRAGQQSSASGIQNPIPAATAPNAIPGVPEPSKESPRRSSKSTRISSLASSPQNHSQTRTDSAWAATAALPENFGVNLVGYATGELGIGEDVRMLAKALDVVNIPFSVINRIPSPSIRQKDRSILANLADHPVHPITIVCMTGFDTAQVWLDRKDLFDGKYVVGYWPWELPRWPEPWHEAYGLVNEIWASSHYTEAAYSATSPVPVHFMPMAVTVDDFAEGPRSRYSLPEDRFLFLFVFDFMSYPARKNPFACIAAFRKAFPRGDEPVNLVLKISNVVEKDASWKKIAAACAGDSRILLMAKTIDKAQVLGLMNACDAYVSLHRAEGFGRTLAEAMLLGKPVIATDFSGNTDFVNSSTGYPVKFSLVDIGEDDYPFCDGMQWAEPDILSAAEEMRRVFADKEAARHRGIAACRYVASHHSPNVVGAQVKARLTALLEMIYP